MCMAVATSAVRAQSPISFYAEAGIGTSRLYGKHSGSDTQIACKAGIGAEYALNKTWALRSALEFVSIGGRDDMDYVRNAGMNELYLQIPTPQYWLFSALHTQQQQPLPIVRHSFAIQH